MADISKPDRHIKSTAACVTSEKIAPSTTSGLGNQRRSAFIVDPATGKLIVDPDFDLVIRQALWGEARRIALASQMNDLDLKLGDF